ncbi:hypothetical protein [Emticicia sp. BO119]|uniref:hypothetical protein n=1 Tax=Emticicia sp. BO119 TaxID=2757768 RepID=UPI0015F0415E|nr:hypothetical protein [Emticicia sp. BO119]MBA4849480.1 hypothetical protein [Emticicia sp. BO119]
MNQYQQITQSQATDAQLFDRFQMEKFQEWKHSRYPYRNQLEESQSNTWKWVLGIFLCVVVGVVSFLLFKNRGKILKPAMKKPILENQENEVEQFIQEDLSTRNGKKPSPKFFSKLQQHQHFRDENLADMQSGKQTFPEFTAWLVSVQGFEKVTDNFYENKEKECEIKVLKNGINIYPDGSTDPTFRAFTEIESLSFREEFLNIIAP